MITILVYLKWAVIWFGWWICIPIMFILNLLIGIWNTLIEEAIPTTYDQIKAQFNFKDMKIWFQEERAK